jgi:hypothetical protein
LDWMVEMVGLTGAVRACALAHDDGAGAVVDYDADADEGAFEVCHR